MEQFIGSFGYLAIFVLMVAESACIPIPSEVTMLLGGALASGAVAGAHLNLILVILAGTIGNVAGSFKAPTYVIAALVALLVLAAVAVFVRRRHAERTTAAGTGRPM